MTRKDYAQTINWKGTATRMISLDELPEYEEGQVLNPGLSWTDGGEFTIEDKKEYDVLFIIEEDVEGHKVDYSNEEECKDLSCEDCEGEKEILIDKNFKVVDFWGWDEETRHAKVFLKEVI